MSYLNQIALATGTLACAVGIGFVMQSTDTAKQRYGSQELSENKEYKPIQADVIARIKPADTKLNIQSIALTSALPESISGFGSSLTLESPVPACEIHAKAEPLAAAMVNVSLMAPCLGNERVTVHHGGMMFTETTAADGSLDLEVPALNKNAFFMLVFADGVGTSAQTNVDDLEDFDRVVVQWKNDTGFQLHAREFGANYGEEGHVWASASREMDAAEKGSGGFLTRVGDQKAAEPLLAEIYTFPSGHAKTDGTIALSVETEVTAINCGRDIEAQSLEMRDSGKLKSQNLLLSVPGCESIGDFLVLNNLLEDLKVARN